MDKYVASDIANRLLSIYNLEDIIAIMGIDEGVLLTFLLSSGFMKTPSEGILTP